jgi:hypothetical protein
MRRFDVLVLALALVVSAAVFGTFFYRARADGDAITVVGAATQRVSSDVVKWRLTFGRNLSMGEAASGYSVVASDARAIVAALAAAGVPSEDLVVHPVTVQQLYAGAGGSMSGYYVNQSITVTSRDVAKIEALAANPAELIGRGVMLQDSTLNYFVSEIAVVKQSLLAAATEDARKRAAEIAGNAGVSLGKIRSARAGVFQITEPYSTEVADYGIYTTWTREKDATVTVRAVFSVR